ncbi:nucleotidyltransferase domain-containing protein [Natronococcus sp. A-GB7]|uniref:nucleotidyltransferase family protein n=1 Tax=Natronococcus sp. A-GB7 TaxID=3037649 RepID=UPI00241F5F06|nr:nucleotidyltransferase domain-containing protein [Natronococcus sp. A-GB7]MDG5820715.1 nucleotidyltransferase domain-containing protein [Natronococcus sp. A-GB7]
MLDLYVPFHQIAAERIYALFHSLGIRLAIPFGSHASGETHFRSDVDLVVELEDAQPTDPEYNERFFGQSADLSETLETNEIDLVDLQRASPELVATILITEYSSWVMRIMQLPFETSWRRRSPQSPRERFDAALTRIDEHLNGSAVTATDGETHDE